MLKKNHFGGKIERLSSRNLLCLSSLLVKFQLLIINTRSACLLGKNYKKSELMLMRRATASV